MPSPTKNMNQPWYMCKYCMHPFLNWEGLLEHNKKFHPHRVRSNIPPVNEATETLLSPSAISLNLTNSGNFSIGAENNYETHHQAISTSSDKSDGEIAIAQGRKANSKRIPRSSVARKQGGNETKRKTSARKIKSVIKSDSDASAHAESTPNLKKEEPSDNSSDTTDPSRVKLEFDSAKAFSQLARTPRRYKSRDSSTANVLGKPEADIPPSRIIKAETKKPRNNSRNLTAKLQNNVEAPEAKEASAIIKSDSHSENMNSSDDETEGQTTTTEASDSDSDDSNELPDLDVAKRSLSDSIPPPKLRRRSIDQFTCRYCGTKFDNLHVLEVHELHESVLFNERQSRSPGPGPSSSTTETRPSRNVRSSKESRPSRNKRSTNESRPRPPPRRPAKKRITKKKPRPVLENPAFACGHCGKGFERMSAVKQHERRHVLGLRFACSYCGKMFGDKCGLNRHILSHTHEKKVKCEECSESFVYKTQLLKHQSRVHGRNSSCAEKLRNPDGL